MRIVDSTSKWVRDSFSKLINPLITATQSASHKRRPKSPCHFRVGPFFLLFSKFSNLSLPCNQPIL